MSRDDVMVTEYGAVTSERPLPAGTTYSATSVTPPDDSELLRTSGRDNPADIEHATTGGGIDHEHEWGQFTERLTEDSDSPYQTASTIEQWLEANKNYSLNVSRRLRTTWPRSSSSDGKGYCEYFATSMAVMLRSRTFLLATSSVTRPVN